jgi:hypothetical protein
MKPNLSRWTAILSLADWVAIRLAVAALAGCQGGRCVWTHHFAPAFDTAGCDVDRCVVCEKGAELAESPGAQRGPLRLTKPYPPADPSQLFDGDAAFGAFSLELPMGVVLSAARVPHASTSTTTTPPRCTPAAAHRAQEHLKQGRPRYQHQVCRNPRCWPRSRMAARRVGCWISSPRGDPFRPSSTWPVDSSAKTWPWPGASPPSLVATWACSTTSSGPR